jgi:hypothetical protein
VVPAWVVPVERQVWDLYWLAFGVHMATRDEVPAPQRPGVVFVTVFGADREMDMPDRRCGQRLAPVWRAFDHRTAHRGAVVRWMPTRWPATGWPAVPDDTTLVRFVRPVVDSEMAVAPQTAPTQVSVELLKQPRGDLADGHVAQRRLDVVARVGLVALPCVLLDLMDP